VRPMLSKQIEKTKGGNSPNRTTGESQQKHSDSRVFPKFVNDCPPILLPHLSVKPALSPPPLSTA
jgi:hypothetical protein